MKTPSLAYLAAGLAATLFTSQGRASITLELGSPEYAAAGEVSINGYVGASPGAVTNLVWDWGDGTTNESWFPATHTYLTNGDYTVAATAYADTGESQTETCSVFISNAGPNIDLWLMDPEYSACGCVSINGGVSTQTGDITNVVWVWGDGTTDESAFPATHQYPANGDYTVEATAYADTGESNTVSCSVIITNICTNIVLQLAEPDYAACGQVSINGYVGASPGAITNLVWSWGEGTTHSSWFPAPHAYSANGEFIVRVTAYSDLNESRVALQPVTVTTITPDCIAPRLSITLNPQLPTLNVSWPAPAEGWRLESTNALPRAAAAWPQVPPPYQTNGGTISVTFTNISPGANQFYRLHKP